MDILYPYARMKAFCHDVFEKLGFSDPDAAQITDVLMLADLFGIHSHGLQRLVRYYNALQVGSVRLDAQPETVFETPLSAVIDGHEGMGQLIAAKAMTLAMEKAAQHGFGIVSVRNSNHYGIAGYYSKMAAEKGFIGISMTNSEPIMVPTRAKKAILGSNPIAVAVPAEPYMFWFDAATTVVPRGKLEVYNKKEEPLPENWAVDETGAPCSDASRVLQDIITRVGGGILPLGGFSEESGSHKGYGYAMICELFTSILSGGATSNHHVRMPGRGAGSCHAFLAISPALFGDASAVSERLSVFMQELRSTPPASPALPVLTHGEKEWKNMRYRMEHGLDYDEKTVAEMKEICEKTGLRPETYFG